MMSIKYISSIFLALFSLTVNSQILNNIENTTWRGIDNDKDYEITFFTNGALKYKNTNGIQVMTYTKGSWIKSGNQIYIEINDKFVERNGEISNGKMSGTAKNKSGKSWNWSYQLIDVSKAQPFESIVNITKPTEMAREEIARAARLKQEEEEKTKQAANVAAQKEAEERDRKLKESPEYKKQQAEIERKKLADEKVAALNAKREQEAAALKAKKEQDEAARQRAANELAAKERNQKQEAALRAQKAQEDRQRLESAKEFPYYAVINCGSGTYKSNPFACFNGNNVNTELEIRNGSAYKMYTYDQIIVMPLENETLVFDLRQKFEMKMQNASDNFILNLKIYNRATNQVVFEKSAAHFGVIRVSN